MATTIDAPAAAAADVRVIRGRRVAFAVVVLLVALVLRLYIVAQGGSYFWTDEKRYNASREAIHALVAGDLPTAAHHLLSSSDHIGFRWLALIPAAVEYGMFGREPPHAKICAGFLALFSVANLWLVWRIARRCSTRPGEPELALAFAASSNALFFFARHCFPYDASLACFLAAALVSVGPPRRAQAFVAGLLCGWGYLIYNGYWSVGAVLLILDVLGRRESLPARARRAALAFVGLLAPIALVFGVAGLCGYNLVGHARAFADTVNQGDFGEGGRFLVEYLWISDGVLGLGLAACALAGAVAAGLQRQAPPWLRWLATAVLLAAAWIFFCDVVEKFVLYGRTVRALIPFLALAAAGAVVFFWQRAGGVLRPVIVAGVAALCLGGVSRMAAPLRQMFPAEFQPLARDAMAKARARDPQAVLETRFGHYLFGPEFPEEPRPHRELLRRTHPQHYLPYLHEGYTRAQRPLYMGHDTAMRVIQLDTTRGQHLLRRSPVARHFAPYPGPLALRLRLPPDRMGNTESILGHGSPAADAPQVLIRYEDPQHIRLGFLPGTGEPNWSGALRCDYAVEHTVAVSLGSFYPPGAAREAWRDTVLIHFDGVAVHAGAARFRPTPLAGLSLGPGVIVRPDGGTPFSGVMHSARQIDPRQFSERVTGGYFGDHHGALELLVRFPRTAGGRSEPVVVTGKTGAADILSVTCVDERHVRFALDHWGTPGLQSDRVPIEPGAVQRLVVSLGSLYPPQEDPCYEATPEARVLRDWLEVRINDRVVFSQPFSFYPAGPDEAFVLHNPVGGTSAGPEFSGESLARHRRDPRVLGLTEQQLTWPRGREVSPHGVVSTLTLKAQLPATWDPGVEPLLVTGGAEASQMLVVRYAGPRRLQVGYRNRTGHTTLSRSIATQPGRAHTFTLTRTQLAVDGTPVLDVPGEMFLARPDALHLGRAYFGTRGVRGRFNGVFLAVSFGPSGR